MRTLLLIVAFLGLLVSGYLLYAYVAGGPIVCSTDGGCEIVRASKYSRLFGASTPLYGVVYYALLGIGAALWQGEQRGTMKTLLTLLTGIGLAMSAWLTYIEAFVVEAWCIWCVASTILALAAFLLVWQPMNLKSKKKNEK